jgi:hypothetical protein
MSEIYFMVVQMSKMPLKIITEFNNFVYHSAKMELTLKMGLNSVVLMRVMDLSGFEQSNEGLCKHSNEYL